MESRFSLVGRTALVTGAGRGIGAGIALALDRAGARVALVARTSAQLDEVATQLHNDPVVFPADLGTPDQPTSVGAAALEAFGGRLDVLVNNAGIGLRKPSDELTAEEIDQLWAVNVRSALLLSAAVLPAMVRAGKGSIVNVSSVAGLRGAPRRAAYAATKAALDGMTRSWAMEYGPQGIRANSVAPGVVATDLWTPALGQDGVADQVTELVALRRLSDASDIADVVVFLASDASRYLTGEVLAVDGGMRSTVNLYPRV